MVAVSLKNNLRPIVLLNGDGTATIDLENRGAGPAFAHAQVYRGGLAPSTRLVELGERRRKGCCQFAAKGPTGFANQDSMCGRQDVLVSVVQPF